jgi:hypothetical protein
VVNDITSWPLKGKYQGGIKIETDGLRFITPATLTITLPAAMTNVIGVSWHNTGAEFHAIPSGVAGAKITLPVGRLGGYGVTTLGAGDVATLRTHPPTQFNEQDAQQIALGSPALAGASVQTKATPRDLPPAIVDGITHSFNTFIRPELEAAANDDSRVDLALAEYGLWKVSLETVYSADEISSLGPLFAEAVELGGKAIYMGLNRAAARCEQHNIQSLGKLVHFGELMEVSPWSAAFTSADKTLFRQKVKNCATFDIDLDSHAEFDSQIGHGSSTVHWHWTIEFKDEALTKLSGSGSVPITDVQYTYTGPPPCALGNISPADGGVQIPEFNLVPNLRDLFTLTNRPSSSGMSVLFNPFLGAPQEGISLNCPPGPSIQQQGFWAIAFGSLYLDNITKNSTGQIFRIQDWGEGAGDVLGERGDRELYSDPGGGFTVDLTAKWTLRHAPVAF